MDRNTRPQQREMMYCHQCENEWYRDEHGLACPECHSDFTEVIEADNDPREDEDHIPGEPDLRSGSFGAAPDPDEDDIDNLHWEQTGPGTYRVRGRYNMDVPLGRNGQPQGQQPGGMGQGLMGIVGNLLQGMVQGQGQGQGQQQGQFQGVQPGQPPQGGPQLHQGHGPGFRYTVTTNSNVNYGGNLFPRNANGPQPFNAQPDHIEQMLAQMFSNVGAMPGRPMRAGGGMDQHPLHGHDPFGDGNPNGGFMFNGGPRGFADILNMFGMPDQHGDAVYTQEALDRIMTQLMEQHTSGNAPGPASEAAIKSLPKRAITKEDQGTDGKAECSICMLEAELGEEVTELPCKHWFHFTCIEHWLKEHDTCPHCRQGIMPKEGEGSAPRNPGQAPLNDMRNAHGDMPDTPNQRAQRQQRQPTRYYMHYGPDGPALYRNLNPYSPSERQPPRPYDRVIPPERHGTVVTRAQTADGTRAWMRMGAHRPWVPLDPSPAPVTPRPQREGSMMSTVSESSTVQDRSRRGRATRWPSAGSVVTISTLNDTRPDARAPASTSATVGSAWESRTPEIRRTETLSERFQRQRSRLFTRARTTARGLRRRRSTLSSRPQSLAHSLRSRRSTFSLRSSGRRHTLSTARASATDKLTRSRTWLSARLSASSRDQSQGYGQDSSDLDLRRRRRSRMRTRPRFTPVGAALPVFNGV